MNERQEREYLRRFREVAAKAQHDMRRAVAREISGDFARKLCDKVAGMAKIRDDIDGGRP